MKVELDVENACVISDVPEQLSPARFRGPWTRTVKGADGQPMTIESGPGTGGWVRYEEISEHMEIGVLVCEDGGFYRHRGFDFRAIEKSVRDNVRAGRFVRGASTITMQLARNLYLGREKTLSRKFEEAILTMLIEQHFQKRELMELYLNVIEFGPGIYGVGPAARHYFSVEPSQLTLGQAFYLASILPSPDHQHFDKTGAVSERWMNYLHKLMGIAHKLKRVSDEELERGLEEQVAFRVAGSEPPVFSDEAPPDTPRDE
jgi:membrane peptidoglycan carboxypeptidase